MDYGHWWLLKVGSRGRGSPLIKDKYLLTYDASHFCLDLWIWLLFVRPAYVFEYMDASNLLNEMWWLNPYWGSFEMKDGWIELEKVKRHYINRFTQVAYV